MYKSTFLSCFFAFLVLCTTCCAEQLEPLNHGHVHEAFMINEAPVTLLQAVAQQPPQPLQENAPQQTDSKTVWIPGYWDWSSERKEYVWCSGHWRVPPPEHQWIPGVWQKIDKGWVRLVGFWSETPVSDLTYIPKPPPDMFNENPTKKPGDDYFWMSGFWMYEDKKYTWYSGSWEQLDANWVYVPPKYVWRPEGYVFVPAFWDWPIETRGTPYACVAVPKGTKQIHLTPNLIVHPQVLVEQTIFLFPDYRYFYFYYTYFNPDLWARVRFFPPWLAWNWWWLPWYDQWSLYWWWVRPGFPGPVWLPPRIITIIYPPPPPVIVIVRRIRPPIIITPFGVIPLRVLFSEIGDIPILPVDPTPIQKKCAEKVKQGTKDRPNGPETSITDLKQHPQPIPETTEKPPKNAPENPIPAMPPKEKDKKKDKDKSKDKPKDKEQPKKVTPPPKPSAPTHPTPPASPPDQMTPSTPQFTPPRTEEPEYMPPYTPPETYTTPPYTPPDAHTEPPSYTPPTHTEPPYTPPDSHTEPQTPGTCTGPGCTQQGTDHGTGSVNSGTTDATHQNYPGGDTWSIPQDSGSYGGLDSYGQGHSQPNSGSHYPGTSGYENYGGPPQGYGGYGSGGHDYGSYGSGTHDYGNYGGYGSGSHDSGSYGGYGSGSLDSGSYSSGSSGGYHY